MTPTVDVAVVAYRHWDLTRSCLEHLARQTAPHRVTLCDNGCDEGTAERAAAEFPDVAVVRLARNMPYAVACNRAVANGNAELVLMMNNNVDAVRTSSSERRRLRGRPRTRLAGHAAPAARRGADRQRRHGRRPNVFRVHPPPGAPQCRGRRCPSGATGPYGAAAASGAPPGSRWTAWTRRSRPTARTWTWHCPAVRPGGRPRWPSTRSGCTSAGRPSGTARPISAGAPATAAGYSRRRYRVLRSRAALRALITEAIVVAGDLVLSRDLAALRGRVAGWRGAATLPPRPAPPAAVLDQELGFLESLLPRRGAYERRPRPQARSLKACAARGSAVGRSRACAGRPPGGWAGRRRGTLRSGATAPGGSPARRGRPPGRSARGPGICRVRLRLPLSSSQAARLRATAGHQRSWIVARRNMNASVRMCGLGNGG